MRATADEAGGGGRESSVDLRCRMFNARGIEDAATGAANCCLMGLLATLGEGEGGGGSDGGGKFTRRIAQGVEMGRPSMLLGECECERAAAGGGGGQQRNGRWPRVLRVAGRCVGMMSGTMSREHFG